MKIRGSELVVSALEDAGARFTFGIPGTHNIELYDALDRSSVLPVLVTDEQGASFMADGVSRSSDTVGVVNLVPGAGVTHALSGIAEAFMDTVPLVVLACGIRRDTGRAFQLHDIDQVALLAPITKAVLRPTTADDLYPAVRRAFDLARDGAPGPVAVEVPAEFYMVTHEADGYREPPPPAPPPEATPGEVEAAAVLLNRARRPLLYLGAGARSAGADLVDLAERLSAAVATTIQGKGVFPESHPLWLWCGLGRSAPRFVRTIESESDAMLAIGCRFSEVGTASYGFTPPADLVHVDIEAGVLDRNFPARLAIRSDAAAFVRALLPLLAAREPGRAPWREQIASGHRDVRDAWRKDASETRVTPAAFFAALARLAPRAIYTTDSGNGTFLAMEHLRLDEPRRFLAPVDFSCMGYAVPAAVGAKLANPDRDVVALAGDGALLMTGLETLTAAQYQAAPLVCVLRDGQLAQIAQFQGTALNRDTCSTLPPYSVEHFAATTGAAYLRLQKDDELERVLRGALERTRRGRVVMVEVAIDYSRKTYFTRGVIASNFWRLPMSERVRMIGRAVKRRFER
jgi:acetolactate synthase-1/2/3 large subunit